MTLQEARQLQVSDRLRDRDSHVLWRVIRRDSQGFEIKAWAPRLETRWVPLEDPELSGYTLVWESGPRPGEPQTAWERILEEP